MYPYHNRILQRIKNGELTGIKKGEGIYAFVLLFSTYPFTRPIKHDAAYRYELILAERNIPLPKD